MAAGAASVTTLEYNRLTYGRRVRAGGTPSAPAVCCFTCPALALFLCKTTLALKRGRRPSLSRALGATTLPLAPRALTTTASAGAPPGGRQGPPLAVTGIGEVHRRLPNPPPPFPPFPHLQVWRPAGRQCRHQGNAAEPVPGAARRPPVADHSRRPRCRRVQLASKVGVMRADTKGG